MKQTSSPNIPGGTNPKLGWVEEEQDTHEGWAE